MDGVWSEERPVLVVDGGDLFGPRNKNEKHQSTFLAEMTGELGYDAIALGERDLNYGLPFLLEMIEKFDLPFTNANVRSGKTGELILPEFLVVERSGIRIGIVSVLDPRQKIISMAASEEVYQVDEPVAVLRELLPRLREKADSVVLLAHLGEQATGELLNEVKGIDMCVIGHTSRNINAERVINDTAVFAAAFEGRYIGRANLFIDDADGRVMAIDVGITALNEEVANDEQMLARVEQFKVDLLEFKTAKRAEYPRTMGSEKETYLGDRACMACHEDAWKVYLDSPHRSAFATIRNKGQSFEPECLSCHTTGYRFKNGYSDESPYNKLANVQCEACHGYGSQHARDNKWVAQAKDSCTLCHDQKNSPEFDYATYWEKIKH
ncbi:MAG: multiheme c-type cytochrome [Candidatus Krumholzibacteriota bacterium]